MSNILNKTLVICFLMINAALFAKDFGVHGKVFPIQEESMDKFFKEQFKDVDQEKLQIDIQKRIIETVKNPKSVDYLKEALVYRSFLFDPSIFVQEDIKDIDGNIIIQKGTHVNPLVIQPFSQGYLFLDGSNQKHIDWALQQKGPITYILTKGSPFDLQEELDKDVFFDQYGALSKRLGLEYIPAKITQEGDKVRIEEFPVSFEGDV